MTAQVSTPHTPRPELLPGGHVLVFSSAFHLPIQGSAVVMRNLLSRFDPKSYTVVTYGPPPTSMDPGLHGARVVNIHSGRRLRHRVGLLWRRLRQPWLERWSVRLARGLSPNVILGVYPDEHMLKTAQVVAKTLQIPFLAYFHDLLEEVHSDTKQADAIRQLQEDVFREAATVFVIGQGMADHYKKTLGLVTCCLQHMYPEEINPKPEFALTRETVFLGGSIYEMNDAAIHRLLEATGKAQLELVLTARAEKHILERMGLTGKGVSVVNYAKRSDYMEAIRHHGILAVVLNWPEESTLHERELATAFPTKVIEYLLSGRPILVHCPEHYFLARFFREHECGLVINIKNTDIMSSEIKKLLSDPAAQARLRTNAYEAAKVFSAQRIIKIFQEEIMLVSKLRWGVKNGAAAIHPQQPPPETHLAAGAD